jgi:hypothetical protein
VFTCIAEIIFCFLFDHSSTDWPEALLNVSYDIVKLDIAAASSGESAGARVGKEAAAAEGAHALCDDAAATSDNDEDEERQAEDADG